MKKLTQSKDTSVNLSKREQEILMQDLNKKLLVV